MTDRIRRDRFADLMAGKVDLNADELGAGWHFCVDWDGLLVRLGSNGCLCGEVEYQLPPETP